jgi:hypothetical protein
MNALLKLFRVRKPTAQPFVFAVLISLGVSLLLVTASVAAPINQGALHKIYITDVRDVQFVVSWTTNTVSDGRVEWGTTTALGNTATDPVPSTTTHYVEVTTGVSPSTTYYFRVRSGALVDDNGGAYYTVTTGPTLGIPPAGDFVYGYVYASDGTTPVSDLVVYLQIQDANGAGSPGSSQLVTARTDATGGWFFSNLYDVRLAGAGGYFTFSNVADNLSLLAQGGSLGTASQLISVPAAYPIQLPSMNLNGTPNAVKLDKFLAQSTTGWTVEPLLVIGLLSLLMLIATYKRRSTQARS